MTTSGGRLLLGGAPYEFAGVDAYEAATMWGTNFGCGGELSDHDLNLLFGGLPANSIVRIWAFQGSMVTNVVSGMWDFAPLDRIVSAAWTHGQRLILTLTDQAGTCDDAHWKDPAWYAGGYAETPSDAPAGHIRASYEAFVQAIVTRYASSPAVAMWEPVNEPEGSSCMPGYSGAECGAHHTCDETLGAGALLHFFSQIGGLIHRLDPNHLVEEGVMGGGQCGAAGSADYRLVGASPGIDVLSYHDYGTGPLPGDQWNGLGVRLQDAAALGKPLIVGELGVMAGDGPACALSRDSRAGVVATKLAAQYAAGAAGVLLWDWVASPAKCNYDIGPGDPVLGLLARAAR